MSQTRNMQISDKGWRSVGGWVGSIPYASSIQQIDAASAQWNPRNIEATMKQALEQEIYIYIYIYI